MKMEQAETIALHAVTFISTDENLLNALMAQSGLGVDDLRTNITQPAFLAGILDFLLNDEPTLLNFCAEQEIQPELIVSARRALPGGQNLWDG
ncbi:MAG: DUF3572 domain-containing protein [Methylocystaceae bacterium]|nr:DUF3572 domain-containing protein [Methylocystaceae bacterium]